VDNSDRKFRILEGTLEVRAKCIDTVRDTSITLSEVTSGEENTETPMPRHKLGEIEYRFLLLEINQPSTYETQASATQSNTETRQEGLGRRCWPNPYGSNIKCIKAHLQTLTFYGDIDLKEAIDSLTRNQYLESYGQLDLYASDPAPWLGAVDKFEFQGCTLANWWSKNRYVYVNGAPNPRTKNGAFIRRVCLGGPSSVGLSSTRSISLRNKMGAELKKVLLQGARLISTRDGYVGWGHQNVRRGDLIALIPGCPIPLILRPIGHDHGYVIVSDVYLYGFLDGHPAECLEEVELHYIKIY
jgi:hypothetical protein